MKKYRLKEKFRYYSDLGPTHWIVEEKLWYGWKNAFSSGTYYRTSQSFLYEEASKRLNHLVRIEESIQNSASRLKTFKPKILYPPLLDEEPME